MQNLQNFGFGNDLLDDTKVKVKLAQSCPTLCDPMDNTVHGLLQASILEWVTFPFSRGSSQPRDRTQVSCNCTKGRDKEKLDKLDFMKKF